MHSLREPKRTCEGITQLHLSYTFLLTFLFWACIRSILQTNEQQLTMIDSNDSKSPACPTLLKQQSSKAIVLQANQLNKNGLSLAMSLGITPMVVPREIGRVTNDRYVWARVFLHMMATCTEAMTLFGSSLAEQKAASNSFDAEKETPTILKGIDIEKDIFRDRCQLEESVYSSPEGFQGTMDNLVSNEGDLLASTKELTECMAKMATLRQYFIAIMECASDSVSPESPRLNTWMSLSKGTELQCPSGWGTLASKDGMATRTPLRKLSGTST